ncbi:MAG: hypothetical protein WAN10_02725 [Candidatus Acidiferrales bacterium]
MNLIVRFSKWSLFLFLAASCFAFSSRLAVATPVTYTYNQGISGSMTLSTGLADDFTGFVTPTSFSFTDGGLTITSAESLAISSFFVVTNGSGAITDWNILLVLSAADVIDSSCCVNGFALNLSDDSGVFAASNGTPGVWSTGNSPVQEPSSIFLLGTGLLGLGPFIRRGLAMP